TSSRPVLGNPSQHLAGKPNSESAFQLEFERFRKGGFMNTAQSERRLLILDLDETLVHTTEAPLADCSCDFRYLSYYVHKRPYLDLFLDACSSLYDIAVWSAGGDDYVRFVIAKIFPPHVAPRFIFTAQRCTLRLDASTLRRQILKPLQ